MALAIVGGSGVYGLAGFPGKPRVVATPFGDPSGPVLEIETPAGPILFLARHGEGHRIAPSEINYRANIFALKKLGATAVLSLSAVGSLREDIAPGDFVLPSQYIDRTAGLRARTFFGGGVVAHAPMADPVCATTSTAVGELLAAQGTRVVSGGTYVCIEGPQFSTRAESEWFRSMGTGSLRPAVVGMTALPEARLAREASLCYVTVAMATDFDCWHPREEAVTTEAILAVIHANVGKSLTLVRTLAESGLPACRSRCATHMKTSVLQPRELWPEALRTTLDVLLDNRA